MKIFLFLITLLLSFNVGFGQIDGDGKKKDQKSIQEKIQAENEEKLKYHNKIQTKKTKRRMKKNRKKSDRLYKNKHTVPLSQRLFGKRKKVKKRRRGKY